MIFTLISAKNFGADTKKVEHAIHFKNRNLYPFRSLLVANPSHTISSPFNSKTHYLQQRRRFL